MNQIFPRLPIIKYPKLNPKNLNNSQNNESIPATLTKSMSCKKSTSFKKGNDSIFSLNNSSTNKLKIIGLKNIIYNKGTNTNKLNSLNNESKTISINEDYSSDFIKKKKIFSKKDKYMISPGKNDTKIERNKLKSIESYQSLKKNNIEFRNKSKDSKKTNYIKNINNSNSKSIYINKNKSMNNMSVSISKIHINKKYCKKLRFTSSDYYKYKNIFLPKNNNFEKEYNFNRYIIERFIDKKNISPIDIKHRIIFIILGGTIVTNADNIQGHFINIPTLKELKKLSDEKRNSILQNLIKNFKNIFSCKKTKISIFSPNKEVIYDLLDIKAQYKYIYISQTTLCKDISIVISPSFVKLYNNEFKEYLNQKNKKIYNNINNNKNKINKNNFKIKEIIMGINVKKEQLKPHYSFSSGENEIINNNYIYYSDDEERKNEAYKDIEKNCILKNDFYIYITKKDVNQKIKNLKKKLNFNTPFNLRESYNNHKVSFEKLLNRYRKELNKKYGLNQINFDSNKDNRYLYDSQDLNNNFDKLYIKKETEKQKLNKKLKKKVYYNIENIVNKYYSHFILYNIPKLLKEHKNFTRENLFESFGQFKDLISLSFSMNKNEFILKNGIDFETFWNCVEELNDENQNFAKKLFKQINKGNLSVLNIKDFMNGIYFIKNSELKEKLELFLKTLDLTGKGEINYDEAVEISRESILRNLTNQNINKQNNILLNELSIFFANFIFKLVGIEKDKNLKIEDLKQHIIEGNIEDNDVEYLEMFCGANKAKYT